MRAICASTTPTWPPRPRDVSTMRWAPRDASEEARPRRPLFFGRGLLLFARAHASALSPFWNAGHPFPPRPFLLCPRFFLFCLVTRPRSFLLFGPVVLVAVSSFAFAHLGPWRPSGGVLRVSREVIQESAPAEHLRAVAPALTDAPRSGAAGLLSPVGGVRAFWSLWPPRVNAKAGGPKKKTTKNTRAAAPRCLVAYSLLPGIGPLWVCGL